LLRVIKDNPGLKPQLPELINDAYSLARVNAAKETKLDIEIFDSACPWTFEQLIDDSFYPD